MKTLSKQIAGFILTVALACGIIPIQAQEDTGDMFITITGVVRDKQTRKKIEYANISIPGTNVGTVTNNDGEFSLKVKQILRARQIEVSHIGYLNGLIPIEDKDVEGYTVWLEPNLSSLNEIIVRAMDPRYIILEAINKVSTNYLPTGSMLTGFYRETAQKGRRYINVSEAIIDLYKTPYKERFVNRDRVQIYKGRKLLSQRSSDTLIVKLLGGPNLSLYIDVVKNSDLLLDPEIVECYAFRMEESVMLNDRPHYVISFLPQVILPFALYHGRFYVDKERLSFSKVEFELSMEDRQKATEAILRKKPYGLRFRPLEVSYVVTYQERDGVSYLSYVRNEVRFKCDWKRKLFSTNYAIVSEMVVTDGLAQSEPIPYKASFRPDQSLSDKVADFADERFWGAYNIIEPTESLENAVHKLKKQYRD